MGGDIRDAWVKSQLCDICLEKPSTEAWSQNGFKKYTQILKTILKKVKLKVKQSIHNII